MRKNLALTSTNVVVLDYVAKMPSVLTLLDPTSVPVRKGLMAILFSAVLVSTFDPTEFNLLPL